MEISRPSDLLQHLLELSLTQSATEIVVEVENGGVTVLRVRDNGKGIINIPTATQKGILQLIHPHCELKVISKHRGSNKGHYYHSMFGHLHDYRELNCEVGTDISIIDMFFNLPDKYRKLKKDSDERQQIINTACRFYISHGIAIKLKSSDKVIFNMPSAQTLEQRISFLPASFCEKRLAVIRHAAGTIYILKSKGVALSNIYEGEYDLPEGWVDQLKEQLAHDKTLFAIVSLKQNVSEEDMTQMLFEIRQHLTQWRLNKEREKKELANSVHKPIERETLLRAKIIKGVGKSESPTVVMDKNELTVTLPNGFTIIIPIRQLGY